MTAQTDAVAPEWWPAVLRGVRARRAFAALLLDTAAVTYDGQLHVRFADLGAHDAYWSSDSHLTLDAAVQSVRGETIGIRYTCDA